MRCFYPLSLEERGEVGRVVRCGRCIGCKVSRSQDWAVRCCNEKLFHDQSVFLTLTWDKDPVTLDHRPFQLFMKRGRKALGPARFFMCGEYGEQFSRPHYHAIIFGWGFPDRELLKRDPLLYRSKSLERLWPFGFSSIGDVTAESAQYVAGYVTSVISGDAADDHYWKLLPSGELVQVAPEYGRMSLKPGIGYRYISRFSAEVTVRDGCVVNGKVMKPPVYYDRQLKDRFEFSKKEGKGRGSIPGIISREKYLEIKEARMYRAIDLNVEADSTPERLKVQENVVKSRMALKRRLLEF